ncbi:TniQ family protein [Microvirga terricola]|uniref:TniQ family protein n=1 Tax=Microvirga terricola TaxID=2719797 RepID=A0ABX0VD25_9HYPH|nr:TniQ family protein [Microvirga terricola]NIX77351.1 TniQ family protein [Microvirga terricola]
MTRLHPSLAHRIDETPTSLVSRLAMLHGIPSVRTFALDVGFPFQAIVDGDLRALTALAELAGQPIEPLAAAAIQRSGNSFCFRGQELTRFSLRRARTVACPRCLAEDLAESAMPWMASGRASWLLNSVRICMHHHVPLVELAHAHTPQILHDFARSVAPALANIPCLAEEAIEEAPTAMETYLRDRIDGKRGPAWLDALPWYAAARICEIIGAVVEFGVRAPIRTFNDVEWRRAGATGFQIAAGGHEGIRACLEAMRRSPSRRSDNGGPQAWFGHLHTWLTHTQADPAYDPLRDIIIDLLRETVPLGPQTRFFGRQVVERRRFYSIRTASREKGLHPKRLRRILVATGIIPADHQNLTDDRIVFEATSAEQVLMRAQRAISHKEAETYLNAGRVQTQLLAKHGFIRPFAACGKVSLRRHAYDPADLEAFLVALLSRAVPIATFKPPVHPIAQAAKRANCGAAEIVHLILDKKLRWVGRKANERGYASILVNTEEVKRLVRSDHGDDLTRRQVETLLRTSTRVVDALVANGILPTKPAISPLNRCPYMAIPKRALDAFMVEYGSLQEIARERGFHFMALKRRLMAKNIEPAFDRMCIGATFYRRRDVPGDL